MGKDAVGFAERLYLSKRTFLKAYRASGRFIRVGSADSGRDGKNTLKAYRGQQNVEEAV